MTVRKISQGRKSTSGIWKSVVIGLSIQQTLMWEERVTNIAKRVCGGGYKMGRFNSRLFFNGLETLHVLWSPNHKILKTHGIFSSGKPVYSLKKSTEHGYMGNIQYLQPQSRTTLINFFHVERWGFLFPFGLLQKNVLLWQLNASDIYPISFPYSIQILQISCFKN